MKKIIQSRFNSKCAETGKVIKKHEFMLYDYSTKKCYHSTSKAYQDYNNPDAAGDMVTENENAYFDNFCINNGI